VFGSLALLSEGCSFAAPSLFFAAFWLLYLSKRAKYVYGASMDRFVDTKILKTFEL